MAGIGALDALALACESVGAAKLASAMTGAPSSPREPATVSDSSADETDSSPVLRSDPSCALRKSQARGAMSSRGTEAAQSTSTRTAIKARTKESEDKTRNASDTAGLVIVDPARLACPAPPVFANSRSASVDAASGMSTPGGGGGSSSDEQDLTSSMGRPGDERDNAAVPITAPSQTSGSEPSDGSLVTNEEVSHNDVLCGRGGLTNNHPGNVFFRRMVRTMQEVYLRATKRDKAGVAKHIVDSIRHLQPPGRFLKKHPSDPTLWIEIDSKRAREKTSQALRERAPELREELQAGGNTNSATESAMSTDGPRSSPSPTEGRGPARCRVVSSESVSVPMETSNNNDKEPVPSDAARQAMASAAAAASALNAGGQFHGGAGANLPFFAMPAPHAMQMEDRNMHLVAPIPQHFGMHGPFNQAPQHHGHHLHHTQFPDVLSSRGPSVAASSSPPSQAQLLRLMSDARGGVTPIGATPISDMGSMDSQHVPLKAPLSIAGTKRARTSDCPPHQQHSMKKSRSTSSVEDAADADDECSQSSTIKATEEATSKPKKMKTGGPRLRRLKERMQES